MLGERAPAHALHDQGRWLPVDELDETDDVLVPHLREHRRFGADERDHRRIVDLLGDGPLDRDLPAV